MNTSKQTGINQTNNVEFIANVNAKLKTIFNKKQSEVNPNTIGNIKDEVLTATNFTKFSREINGMDFSNILTEALTGTISV